MRASDIRIVEHGRLVVGTGVHVSGAAIMQVVPSWKVLDGDVVLGFIIANPDVGPTLTDRIGELLERHGLADLPDDAREVTD